MRLEKTIFSVFKKATVFWLSILLLIAFGSAHAQQNLEYKIKAAFLYKFTKFVEWPGLKEVELSNPFVFGVLGEDPFGDELDMIKEKIIKGRSVTIKRFASMDDYEPCHLLFISPSEKDRLKATLKKLKKNKNLLIVGDVEEFAGLGGGIGFVKKRNKMRFEINLAAATRAGLKISSNLLKLATIVDTEPDLE